MILLQRDIVGECSMKVGSVNLVVGLLVSSCFFILFSGGVAEGDSRNEEAWSALDTMRGLEAFKENNIRHGESLPVSNSEFDSFSYLDGPYPEVNADGSFRGAEPLSRDWGINYVSDVMYTPPHNPGGGFSIDATGGAGYIAVGNTHETYVGDLNANDNLEWITYYSYKPWGEDGKDNDGDGCIDEKTYGDWDGQTGCDLIPDQIKYIAAGGLPDAGGKHGTLVALVNWYGEAPVLTLYRIFTTQPWEGYDIELFAYYPEIVDNEDIVSYYAHEGGGVNETGIVNANPEVDNDYLDWYVGSVDARGFPGKDPTNHACFAGYRLYKGASYLRDDGYAVTSFELREEYDDRDWNGDGDKTDYVAAYYVVDPATGKCDQGVNGGVYGEFPRNSGLVLTPGYTFESEDSRDWNGDGDMVDSVQVWHDINSTWSLVGHRYTSFTFTNSPGQFGFGFWGRYSDMPQFQTFSLRFGGAFYEGREAANDTYYYESYYFLTEDEDGDPQTILPKYRMGYGKPGSSLSGVCVHIYTREIHLEYAGVNLIGGIADGNGDGDTLDTLNSIYCPDGEGGGEFVVESTSKYAKGLYEDPIPFIWVGSLYFSSAGGDLKGLVVLPMFYNEQDIDDDANGNLQVEYAYYHGYYWVLLPEERMRHMEGGFQSVAQQPDRPTGTIGNLAALFDGDALQMFLDMRESNPMTDCHRAQDLCLKDLIDGDEISDSNSIGAIYQVQRREIEVASRR
jgi:hypothetical protein